MNTGGGLQWNERGTDGLVLSTEIHQEISWRNVGDARAPLRLVERRIAWAMCGRPHNTTRVSHSSVPASDCHCFCEANSRVCQSMKSVIASASLSGGMNAIIRTVSIAVPMKTKLVVGPSTLAIGTPSVCVTA